MKLASPKSLIAILSFAAVVSAAVVDFGRTAPGQLMAAHARIDGLADESSCSQCHGGWSASMTASCLDCHGVIEEHLEKSLGLHGVLDSTVAQDCAACHSEHHGASFSAVNALSFARAGVQDVSAFEHRRIGFHMDGAHLELECAECHEHSEADIVPEGAHRYLGLSQSCASCHEDVHEGSYRTTCLDCHSQHTFDAPEFEGHGSFLELVGGHAGLTCAECHAEGTPHSLSAHRTPTGSGPEARSCSACHDLPHADSFVLGAAAVQGLTNAADLVGIAAHRLCSECHQPEHTSFQEDAEELSPELHAASGFPLEDPHQGQSCAQCHDPELSFGERYPGRDADTCAACHDDVHGGQFAGQSFPRVDGDPTRDMALFLGGEVDETGCLTCHARTHFEPHTFGPEAHGNTALPLSGAHLEAECASCHRPDESLGGARAFHGTSATCADCHDDAHAGYFDEKLAAHPATEDDPLALRHGDCARCHDAAAFGSAHLIGTGIEFDHAFWTDYELTGAHRAAECASCHRRSDEADGAGRTFGSIQALYGEVTGCITCHTDVHAGTFDGGRLPESIDGREDCARCHSTATFRDLPHGFDHGRWTGWDLRDAHAATDCASCHEPLRRPDAGGRTWGRAQGTDCASCHESAHGDQFGAQEGLRAKACAKCHQSAKAFSVLSFDHGLESRFPLDEAHQAVECSGCHRPDETTEIVVYRPLSRECVDCHGVHEKALRRRKRR